MATTRTNKVEVEIVAIDEASPKIDRLEKKIDGLESDEARIIVTSNVDRLNEQLDDARRKLDGLDGDEATVQARLVGNLESDLEAATRLFEQLDGQTGTVTFTANSDDIETAARRVGDIGKSADSSKSALANMIGNTTQDLGSLGGVAGSAGVAIGQMAEYASDAALAGENLSSVFGNMLRVGGPIAGLAVAIYGIQSTISAYKEQAEASGKVKAFNAENAEEFARWAGQGLDLVEEFLKVAAEQRGIEIAPNADQQTEALRLLAQAGEDTYDVIQRINDSEGPDWEFYSIEAGDELKNLRDDLLEAKINAEDFFAAASNPAKFDAFVRRVKATNADLESQADILSGLVYVRDQYAAGLREGTADQFLFGDAARESSGALEDAANAARDLRSGTDDAGQAMRDFVDDTNAAIATAVEFSTKVNNAEADLRDLAGAEGEMRSDALAAAFDISDDTIDTLSNLQQINEQIRGFAEWVRTEGVPNIFDADDVDAAPFLARIQQLQGPIQDAVAQAFGESGPNAATAMAESFVRTLAEQSGLTREQVVTLLGLDNLQADIRVAIRETELAQARRQLELLVGLGGGVTPWTASIALALDAGTIDPEAAQTLIQRKLRSYGVEIPSTIAAPDTDAAVRDAQNDLAGRTVTIPAKIDLDDSELARIRGLLSGSAPLTDPRPHVSNVTIVNPPGSPAQIVDGANVYVQRNGVRTDP